MSFWHSLYILAVDTSVKLETTEKSTGDDSTIIKNVPKADPNNVIAGVLNSVYFMIGIAAIIAIIVGGIMYATSGGDSNQITKAKNVILYAVIGVIVTLLAFGITGFVIARVG
jgi:hypothetical protein